LGVWLCRLPHPLNRSLVFAIGDVPSILPYSHVDCGTLSYPNADAALKFSCPSWVGIGDCRQDRDSRSNAASFRGNRWIQAATSAGCHDFTVHTRTPIPAEYGSWLRKKGRYIPRPRTKEDRNVPDQATSGGGSYSRRGDRRHRGPCRMCDL